MDTSFVGEGAVSSDVIVEGNGYIDSFSHDVLEISEGGEIVFAFDVFFVGSIHTSEKTTEGSDPVSLPNTEDGGIDVSCTGFKSTVSVGDSTTSIIVEVAFDIA